MTRVLVTGAAGFIGSHLVEALVRQGDEVIGIDNFDPFYPRAVKERNLAEAGRSSRFTFHELDLLDTEGLRSHLTPDTVVIHLAAKAGVRPSLADPVGYAQVNVTGTASVAEAARRAGVSRILFGSSSSVYGDDTPVPFREDAGAVAPVSPYAATKRAAELLLRSVAAIYGFRVASLRFFTVYGPRQRPDLAIHAFTRKMVAGEPITLFGDGTQERDYVYVGDVAEANWRASTETLPALADLGSRAWNIGTGRGTSVNELARRLMALAGTEVEIQRAPARAGELYRSVLDASRASSDLDWRPAVSLDEGLERTLEHLGQTLRSDTEQPEAIR